MPEYDVLWNGAHDGAGRDLLCCPELASPYVDRPVPAPQRQVSLALRLEVFRALTAQPCSMRALTRTTGASYKAIAAVLMHFRRQGTLRAAAGPLLRLRAPPTVRLERLPTVPRDVRRSSESEAMASALRVRALSARQQGTMTTRERCPTCGQPVGPWKPSRICALCGLPILKGHKWRIEGSVIQHRMCKRPDAYETTPAPEEQ